jgi:hypothetical protein
LVLPVCTRNFIGQDSKEPTNVESATHDCGTYLDVVCFYDEGTEGEAYALRCESEGPTEWPKSREEESAA